MKRAHRLRPNRGGALPQLVIYFDCETWFEEGRREQIQPFRLAIGQFRRYRKGKEPTRVEEGLFISQDDFFDWVESHVRDRTVLYLFAHNMDFDWTAIDGFNQMSKRGWELDWWALSSNVFILRWSKETSRIVVLDSMQYFPTTIGILGEHLGKGKLPMPSRGAGDGAWAEYCQRDVEILRLSIESLFNYIKSQRLGKFSYSLSGQAFNAYRHRFMEDSIYIHNFSPVTEDERDAYHGGRTECFYIGEVPDSPIYVLDVHSMYPAVMRSGDYPIRYLGTERKPDRELVSYWASEAEPLVVGEVELSEPALAYRGERLIFPVGRFRGAFTGPEVRFILEHGKFIKVDRMHVYQRGQIFKDYVDFFWAERQEAQAKGDRVLDLLAKRFMNSLYGKFGQRNPVFEEVADLGVPVFGKELQKEMGGWGLIWQWTIAGKVYEQVGREEAYNSFPAIAAWVTGYGRLLLWSYIERAGQNNVYYCDTDSLFVNEEGYLRLQDEIREGELGKLGLQGIYEKVELYGSKDYVLDGRVKIKGVPESAIKAGPNEYEFVTFQRILTQLQQDEVGVVHQVTRRKRLRREYDKGQVSSTGAVIPFVLSG